MGGLTGIIRESGKSFVVVWHAMGLIGIVLIVLMMLGLIE